MGLKDLFRQVKQAGEDIEKSKSKGNKGTGRDIDDSRYHANYDYYINKECPYCQAPLKQILKKANCPSCKEPMINERHFDTKKQMLLTKEQAENLAIEKKHYQDLKWAIQLAEDLELNPREMKKLVSSTQVNTKFSILYVRANDMAMKYALQSEWLSYRNTRQTMGDIVQRDGHLKKALDFYLAVCFLDLNGPDDEGNFDVHKGSPKPRVLDSICEITKELDFDKDALKELYISINNLEKNRFIPLSPEETWDKFLSEYMKRCS
jgi:hypothetical protein